MEHDERERFEDDGESPAAGEVVAVASGVVPGVVAGVARGVPVGFASRRRDACLGRGFRRAAAPDIFSGFEGVRVVPCRGGVLALGRWGIGRALSRRVRVQMMLTAAVPRDDGTEWR